MVHNYLVVPFLERQRIRYGKPIPVDFEIGRLAMSLLVILTGIANDKTGNDLLRRPKQHL